MEKQAWFVLRALPVSVEYIYFEVPYALPYVAYKHVTRVEIKPIRFPNASVLSFVK